MQFLNEIENQFIVFFDAYLIVFHNTWCKTIFRKLPFDCSSIQKLYKRRTVIHNKCLFSYAYICAFETMIIWRSQTWCEALSSVRQNGGPFGQFFQFNANLLMCTKSDMNYVIYAWMCIKKWIKNIKLVSFNCRLM